MFGHHYPASRRPLYSHQPFHPYVAPPPSYHHPPYQYDHYPYLPHDEPHVDAATYRDIAREHQEQARLALALAEEREQRDRQYRHRQTAINRLRRELAELEGEEQREQLAASHSGHLAPHAAGFERRPRSRSPMVHGLRRPIPVQPEPEVEEQGPISLESLLLNMLRAVDQPRQSQQVSSQRQQRVPTAQLERRIPVEESPQPSPTTTAVPTSTTTESAKASVPAPPNPTPRGDLASRIRGALNETRSEEEKDAIMRALAFVGREKASEKTTSPATPKESTSTKQTTQPLPESTTQPPVLSAQARVSLLSAIDAIQDSFDHLKSTFTFPSHQLDFTATSTRTAPKLAYTATNAHVNAYEAELVKLLTKLDGIDSGGVESVRGARKALVLAVEDELDALEERKRDQWERSQSERDARSEDSNERKEGEPGLPDQAVPSASMVSSPKGSMDQADAQPATRTSSTTISIQPSESAVDKAPTDAAENTSTPVTLEVLSEPTPAPGEANGECGSSEIVTPKPGQDITSQEPSVADPPVERNDTLPPSTTSYSAAPPSAPSPRASYKVEIEEVVDEDN